MKAALSTKGTDPEILIQMASEWPGLDNVDMVKEVTCAESYDWLGDEGSHWVCDNAATQPADELPMVIAYDFGIKKNILRHLSALGLIVKVVPATFNAEEALELNPDGIFLSNGPGDPAGLPYAVETVTKLIESGKPIFGICLGHQLIGRALNGETRRLKFGHHGGNHPVQDLRSGKVVITAQNHNFTVEENSLDLDEVEITHKSLNDDTLEGLHLKHKPVFSVQYHPEASPGPHDANHLFTHFNELIRENIKGN
jgi:carbamoyl-phosphate synthase small subunit